MSAVKSALRKLGQIHAFPEIVTLQPGQAPRIKKKVKFREEFVAPPNTNVNWFPGHMAKSLKQLKNMFLPRSHIILEVRDSRVPLSSVNQKLEDLIKESAKPRVIAYNKFDLLNIHDKKKLRRYTELMYPNDVVVFSDGRDKRYTKSILNAILDGRNSKWDSVATVVCIMGMPNVGKSTIINCLRKGNFEGKGAKVAPMAGVTRCINLLKVHADPPVSIMDSPGIFIPALDMDHLEEGLKLALTGAVPDYTLNPLEVADYLLFRLNKAELFSYKRLVGLNRPSDDIYKVLQSLSELKSFHNGAGQMNEYWTSEYFVRMWREQHLASFLLDDLNPVIEELEKTEKRKFLRKTRKQEKDQRRHDRALEELSNIWEKDGEIGDDFDGFDGLGDDIHNAIQ